MGEEYAVVMEDFSWKYEDTTRYAVKSVDLKIKKGEIVVITGPSGAGKTTLCRAINGLIPHFYRGELKGNVIVEGFNTREADLITLSSRVGMCFDDPSNQLFSATVLEEVAFGASNFVKTRKELIERVEDSMKFCRIEKYRDKSPHALSGGEKQSVALASIIAMRPSILVLDEPTSNLDPYGTRLVFDRISQLVREQRHTLIIVEHKLDQVLPFADRLVIMNEGEILVEGPPKKVLTESEIPWELNLQIPPVSKIAYTISRGKLPYEELPLTLEEGVEYIRKLVSKGFIRIRESLKAPKTVEKPSSKRELIVFKDVWYEYPDGTLALKGIDLTIYDGEFIGIIGRNGSGKTTLAKMINGLYKPTRGVVYVEGYDTREVDISFLSTIVGYTFQNPDDQLFAKTVREELAFGPKNLGLPREEIEERVKLIAREFGLEEYLDVSPFTLSQGLRQKTAVASVLTMNPKVLVVDEPTTGQDYARAKVMMELFKKLHREGRTIVVISHNMDLIAEYCERVIVMLNGEILLEGPTREVFSKPEILAKSSLEPPQVTQLCQKLRSLGLPQDVLTLEELLGLLEVE